MCGRAHGGRRAGVYGARVERLDRLMFDLCARHAVRAWGRVEPNPLVGCVLARPMDGTAPAPRETGAFGDAASLGWEILGIGHHRRFGGAHAEVEAIANAAARGRSARGATGWVSLEPCDHTGKTGPCSRALIGAGVAEVVFARRDPNPVSRGGAESLARAGVRVREFVVTPGAPDAAFRARALAEPFVGSLRGRTPWVIAKWAQTPAGSLVAPAGDGRWISCEKSRRRVHAMRARVGAIVTGVGTVLADDPLLTVRGRAGSRGRAAPRRVVLDSSLRTPPGAALLRGVKESPVLIVCAPGALRAHAASAAALRGAGAELLEAGAPGGRADLAEALGALRARGVHTVLLEAGPTLLAGAFEAGLVDEACAFVGGGAGMAPDDTARACAIAAPALASPGSWERALVCASGVDALAVWRRRAG